MLGSGLHLKKQVQINYKEGRRAEALARTSIEYAACPSYCGR